MNLKEYIRKVLKEETNSSDMKTVQSELMNMFGGRIKIVNNKIGSYGSTFNVVFDNLDQEILNKINQFMTSKGWFPTNIGFSGLKGRIYSQNVNDYLDEDDVQISYEAHLPEAIKVNQTKAYHVTPDIFFNQINEKGLVLKSESKLSNHPERVYLYRNEDKHKEIVWSLWNSLSKEKQEQIKNYYVLEIDLTQIPNHQFFNDPQSMVGYGAIYTDKPIPKSAIKVIGKIDTKDIETVDKDEMSKEEEKIASNELKQKEKERLDLEKQQEKSDLEDVESRKKFDELPDNLKNMDINDLLSLEEQIIKVLREETSKRTSNHDYSNLIQRMALDYVDFDICKMVVKKIDNLKDQYLIILMTEKYLKSSYREELQNHIEELTPFTIYVSIADGLLNCNEYVKKSNSNQLSESKVPSQVLRRHNLIDNLFTSVRSRFSKRICDYRHPDHFLGVLYERVLEDLYFAWFYETVTDDEWDIASRYIEEYLDNKYKESTVMYWIRQCKKNNRLYEDETKEGLLDDLQNFFTKKKNRNTNDDIKRFTCEDCGDPDYQMYMVNDNIWNEYGNNSNTLCMSCLEKRMGRKLTKDDFSQHKDALTNQHNDEVQDILSNDFEYSSQELQERCWKGYTQKGMKTMFGKRYPNCVKKTK